MVTSSLGARMSRFVIYVSLMLLLAAFLLEFFG